MHCSESYIIWDLKNTNLYHDTIKVKETNTPTTEPNVSIPMPDQTPVLWRKGKPSGTASEISEKKIENP